MARFLCLGPDDNVVTIATDGFDRYPSVLVDLAQRKAPITDATVSVWFEAIFRSGSAQDVLDVRPREQKERLFCYKEETWRRFGYSLSYLGRMKSQSFWEEEFAKIREVDAALARARNW